MKTINSLIWKFNPQLSRLQQLGRCSIPTGGNEIINDLEENGERQCRNREQGVLTLGSLCLPRYMRDTT